MAETFDAIAELYDLMVPWGSRLARESPFFRKIFGDKPRRVLDAACGTGRHAVFFSQMGHHVTGTDISTALRAWRSDEMERIVLRSGFSSIEFYGGYGREPFLEKASRDIIGVAHVPMATICQAS